MMLIHESHVFELQIEKKSVKRVTLEFFSGYVLIEKKV